MLYTAFFGAKSTKTRALGIMFAKNLKISYLLDFYGAVLDEHTKAIMESYYNDDLSLAEIASEEGLSRQGVRHIIKRGEEQLSFLEERLGLASDHEKLKGYTERLSEFKSRLESKGDSDGARLIEEVIEHITNKGF